jgi:hypothetical protein
VSGAAGRKRFDFAPIAERRQRAWRRGIAQLVLNADRGDPHPLIDYLGEGVPRQLSKDDCEWLAWLVKRKLPAKNGRPRGSVTVKNDAVACAALLLRIGKAAWCRKHGFNRAPAKGPNKAPIDALASLSIELVEAEFPQVHGQIIAEDVIERSNLKPSSEVVEYVTDNLVEARRKITVTALK